MSLAQKEKEYYTYDDYAAWDTDERYEIIHGLPVAMAAPSAFHQAMSVELSRQFSNFLLGKPCMLFTAPFDVRLNADKRDDIVVQPDLLVVCDRTKLGIGKNLAGAPDFIIEILSPSNSRHDQVIKSRLYEEAGVKEYWIIDQERGCVYQYILKNGGYFVNYYGNTGTAPVHVLEGFEVDLAAVFAAGNWEE